MRKKKCKRVAQVVGNMQDCFVFLVQNVQIIQQKYHMYLFSFWSAKYLWFGTVRVRSVDSKRMMLFFAS